MDTREGCRPSTLRVVLHDRRHYTAITIHTVYQSICPFHCDIYRRRTILYRHEIFSSPLTQYKRKRTTVATGRGTAAENTA
mmetsp:Transcript_3927/g.4051  ORF Transcript_3927/g.4051 Transcript_3927/m.4051 type:complete len:81 (-) Transcript_3927:800-1042(-)